jgi:hypothetical protein
MGHGGSPWPKIVLVGAVLFAAGCGTIASTPEEITVPTSDPGQMFRPTPAYADALGMRVSWTSPVNAPQESFVIAIELTAAAGSCDWVLGDVSGEISRGRLNRGESTEVTLPLDWGELPLFRSRKLYYVYGQGDDGSTFAQAVTVVLFDPAEGVEPTPTASCGYASFAVVTAPDLRVDYPDASFVVMIENGGILQCGDLDWWVVTPSVGAGMLSCSPDQGLLEGAQGYGESTQTEIACSVDWEGIAPGETKDGYLVLFSYPRVNGVDSVHLVRVRAARP